MLFDPTKLPDQEWLKVSEVVNFRALNKALDANATSPADRAYLAQIDEAIKRCYSEARNDPKHSALLDLLRCPDEGPIPCSTQLRECEAAWPPCGRHLYDLVVGWEGAHEQDNNKRDEAEREVTHWLRSSEVVFSGKVTEGDRRGRRELIKNIIDPMIFWGHDRIVARPPQDSAHPLLVWDERLDTAEIGRCSPGTMACVA